MNAERKSKLAAKLVATGAHELLLEYIEHRKHLTRTAKPTNNIFEDMPRYYADHGKRDALEALDVELRSLVEKELEDA